MTTNHIKLNRADALIVVDVQNDFLPGGSLAVPEADAIVPVLNQWIDAFAEASLPVYATRDWHPERHCSFRAQGGPWPPHCVAGTAGAQFAATLTLPQQVNVISKGIMTSKDAYSGFEGTALNELLIRRGVKRVFVGGLATDYCVLNTVKDALRLGFKVVLLGDAIRAVEVHPGDSARALEEMRARGAVIHSQSSTAQ